MTSRLSCDFPEGESTSFPGSSLYFLEVGRDRTLETRLKGGFLKHKSKITSDWSVLKFVRHSDAFSVRVKPLFSNSSGILVWTELRLCSHLVPGH